MVDREMKLTTKKTITKIDLIDFVFVFGLNVIA